MRLLLEADKNERLKLEELRKEKVCFRVIIAQCIKTPSGFPSLSANIDIRKRGGLATLLLSIFYLQLSTPEANVAQLVW